MERQERATLAFSIALFSAANNELRPHQHVRIAVCKRLQTNADKAVFVLPEWTVLPSVELFNVDSPTTTESLRYNEYLAQTLWLHVHKDQASFQDVQLELDTNVIKDTDLLELQMFANTSAYLNPVFDGQAADQDFRVCNTRVAIMNIPLSLLIAEEKYVLAFSRPHPGFMVVIDTQATKGLVRSKTMKDQTTTKAHISQAFAALIDTTAELHQASSNYYWSVNRDKPWMTYVSRSGSKPTVKCSSTGFIWDSSTNKQPQVLDIRIPCDAFTNTITSPPSQYPHLFPVDFFRSHFNIALQRIAGSFGCAKDVLSLLRSTQFDPEGWWKSDKGKAVALIHIEILNEVLLGVSSVHGFVYLPDTIGMTAPRSFRSKDEVAEFKAAWAVAHKQTTPGSKEFYARNKALARLCQVDTSTRKKMKGSEQLKQTDVYAGMFDNKFTTLAADDCESFVRAVILMFRIMRSCLASALTDKILQPSDPLFGFALLIRQYTIVPQICFIDKQSKVVLTTSDGIVYKGEAEMRSKQEHKAKLLQRKDEQYIEAQRWSKVDCKHIEMKFANENNYADENLTCHMAPLVIPSARLACLKTKDQKDTSYLPTFICEATDFTPGIQSSEVVFDILNKVWPGADRRDAEVMKLKSALGQTFKQQSKMVRCRNPISAFDEYALYHSLVTIHDPDDFHNGGGEFVWVQKGMRGVQAQCVLGANAGPFATKSSTGANCRLERTRVVSQAIANRYSAIASSIFPALAMPIAHTIHTKLQTSIVPRCKHGSVLLKEPQEWLSAQMDLAACTDSHDACKFGHFHVLIRVVDWWLVGSSFLQWCRDQGFTYTLDIQHLSSHVHIISIWMYRSKVFTIS